MSSLILLDDMLLVSVDSDSSFPTSTKTLKSYYPASMSFKIPAKLSYKSIPYSYHFYRHFSTNHRYYANSYKIVGYLAVKLIFYSFCIIRYRYSKIQLNRTFTIKNIYSMHISYIQAKSKSNIWFLVYIQFIWKSVFEMPKSLLIDVLCVDLIELIE